jgi:hypothetical protein
MYKPFPFMISELIIQGHLSTALTHRLVSKAIQARNGGKGFTLCLEMPQEAIWDINPRIRALKSTFTHFHTFNPSASHHNLRASLPALISNMNANNNNNNNGNNGYFRPDGYVLHCDIRFALLIVVSLQVR